MTIRIVTDSSCDLPRETIARYGIHVEPLYIHIGKQSYRDGVDISREEFYTRLPDFPDHPKTAVPSIEKFRAAYQTLVDEGASDILSIHISRALSAVVDVAHAAAQEIKTGIVHVIDSQQLSLGSGFLVETAARLAAENHSLADIQAAIRTQIQRTHVFAALETLEFLKRSGRMNKYLAGFATLLQVKPILTMHRGKPGTERVRTRQRAMKRLVEMLEAVGKLESVALVHTHALTEQLAELRERAAHLLPVEEVLTVDITPVIGVHIGPGALGFAVVGKSE